MTISSTHSYKQSGGRYAYYYQRLLIFYQKPIIQVSTAVLLTIGSIIIFATLAIKPTLQTISELLRKIEDQKLTLIQAEKKSASLATAQQQYIEAAPYLYTLDTALPNNYVIQEVTSSIEALAGSLNLPINNLNFTSLDYPESSLNLENQTITINLSITGTYPEIKNFINLASKLPRIISFDSINLTQNNYTQTPSNSNTALPIIATINCIIYYQPLKSQ